MTQQVKPAPEHRRPRRACFSFAAYAKALVSHLRSSGIPVEAGLSDAEFGSVESALGFQFPPDLRALLREGLPVGAGFPDWRSASPQQLRALLSLPVSSILGEVSGGNGFWSRSWGPRLAGGSVEESVSIAESALGRAPVLVPIYRHFYVPCRPHLAGNPVFFVRGGVVRCAGLDLAGFFRNEEVRSARRHRAGGDGPAPAPAWAAKTARRIEVWSEMAAESSGGDVRGLLEEVARSLRDGGWGEEEVREMVGSDGGGEAGMIVTDRESVAWRVRVLGLALLRGGWSAEDVAYSVGEGGEWGRGRQLRDELLAGGYS